MCYLKSFKQIENKSEDSERQTKGIKTQCYGSRNLRRDEIVYGIHLLLNMRTQ